MTDVLIYMADQVKGKSIYPLIRIILNIVFLASISNFIILRCYPEVRIPGTLDYQKIFDFCVGGYFFIPFSIFMIIYLSTQFISGVLFMWLGDLKNRKLTRRIIAFQIKKNDLKEGFEGIEEVASQFAVIDLTKEKLLEFYKILKPKFNKKDLTKLLDKLEDDKSMLSENFAMIFRGLIAVTIYFMTIPFFGAWLYSFSVIAILVCLMLLIVAYKLVDILPHIMKKAIEAEKIHNQEDK